MWRLELRRLRLLPLLPPPPQLHTPSCPRPVHNPCRSEVPVSVNGARTIEGTDKREPFSESTKTVLVFANGAVIRLASSVSPGQLLFVTNEKSKKEVVCQVVKSKNYRTVTGYVELEFTEPAAGFWGVRIPSEPSPVPGAAPKTPVAARPAAPVAHPTAVVPKTPAAGIAPPVTLPTALGAKPSVPKATPGIPPALTQPSVAPAAPVVPGPEARNASRQGIVPEAPKPDSKLPTISEFLAAAPSPVAPTLAAEPPAKPGTLPAQLAQQLSSLANADFPPLSGGAAQPPAPVAPSGTSPVPAAKSTGETSDELRQQAARLQEQLSSLLFRDETAGMKPAPAVVPAPVEPRKEPAAATKLPAEIATPLPRPVPAQPVPPAEEAAKPVLNLAPAAELKQASSTPVTAQFNLKVEEVKIPSWLVPLARETESGSPSASSTEISESAGTENDARPVSSGVTSTGTGDASASPQTVVFGNQLLSGAASTGQPDLARGSKKGMWLSLAATAALVLGGGAWYGLQPGHFLSAGAQSAPASSFPAVGSASPSPAAAAPAPVAPVGSTTPAAANLRPAAIPPAGVPGTEANKVPGPSAIPVRTAPAVEEPRKPVLGDVHLGTPNVNRNQETASTEAAPLLDATDSAPANDPLASIASGDHSQPAVPVPVGGDVKPAQLLKSVPPVYPTAAKTQRVAGDVKLDALIDANGNVTATRVLSGSPLLHVAAAAAVKQWKYQPAMLDGKPTSMHLTVTVQFRLQ